MRLPRALLYTATALVMVVATQGCGKVEVKERPKFEVFETRISSSLTDPKTKQTNEYSAMLKAYINHVDGTVNVTLVEPSPKWTLQCEECTDSLMARASVVIGQAYPEYRGLKLSK